MPQSEEHVRADVGFVEGAEPYQTLHDSNVGAPVFAAKRRWVLRGYGVVLAVLTTLLVVGVTVVGLSSEARHQVALSIARQPEKYTELYLSADRRPQVSPSPDGEVISVSFTVVNHEGRTTEYPYSVRLVDPSEAPVARAGGSLEVGDGSAVTTTVAVGVPASATWSAVEVDLEGRAEHLRFLRSQLKAAGG
jgi:hypothetical protein